MFSNEDSALSYECDLTAEIERLRAENAALREAAGKAISVLEGRSTDTDQLRAAADLRRLLGKP